MIDYTLPLDDLPDPLPIVPLERPFDVTITPPGSKSITNRAYVLAALADGESRIIRPLRSEDTDGLLDALCALGAEAKWVAGEDGEDVLIKGVAGRFPRGGSVNLGDGGTPTRFMIAAACLAAEPVTVDGSKRMRERPIAEGVDMLRKLGATIEYVEEEGRLPVRVVPSDVIKGGELTVGKTASSQFISAVMLIAPWLARGIKCEQSEQLTSEGYIWLTRDVLWKWHVDLREFGWPLEREAVIDRDVSEWGAKWKHWMGVPSHRVTARAFDIEPDASSAAYWFAAATICAGSRAEVPGLADSWQPDAKLLSAVDDLGAIVCGDSGGVFVEGTGGFRPEDAIRDTYDFANMPDASLAFAVCASTQAYPVQITGLHTLRVKETDRIAALANELRKVGCTVETTDDSITITPPSHRRDTCSSTDQLHRRDACATGGTGVPPVYPATIETYNDHRMAMSFAILGLVRPGISIANPKCVAKSYPTFWRDFARLYESPASGGSKRHGGGG